MDKEARFHRYLRSKSQRRHDVSNRATEYWSLVLMTELAIARNEQSNSQKAPPGGSAFKSFAYPRKLLRSVPKIRSLEHLSLAHDFIVTRLLGAYRIG